MTMENSSVTPLEHQAIKSVKDGTAFSAAKVTSIDDLIKDTWSGKNGGANAAIGHTSGAEVLMSSIFESGASAKKYGDSGDAKHTKYGDSAKKTIYGDGKLTTFGDVAEAANFGTLDAFGKKTGDSLDDKFKSAKADDPNSQLEQAISAAQTEAAQRVMSNPQWDSNYMRNIASADRALRAHPNLGDEIDQARSSAGQSEFDLQVKNQKIQEMVNNLKPNQAEFVRTLLDADPTDRKSRDTLRMHYPEIYQQAVERDTLSSRCDSANRNHNDLQGISGNAVNSHLDYARFLNRRGGQGDSTEMANQLADITRIDPSIVNPYGSHQQFHDVRDLARNLDYKHQGIFAEVLSQQGIQPETYFSSKFDRYDGVKAKMVGKETAQDYQYAPGEKASKD